MCQFAAPPRTNCVDLCILATMHRLYNKLLASHFLLYLCKVLIGSSEKQPRPCSPYYKNNKFKRARSRHTQNRIVNVFEFELLTTTKRCALDVNDMKSISTTLHTTTHSTLCAVPIQLWWSLSHIYRQFVLSFQYIFFISRVLPSMSTSLLCFEYYSQLLTTEGLTRLRANWRAPHQYNGEEWWSINRSPLRRHM